MAEIIRGTTPTLKFNFREVNPAQIETAYLVLKQLGAERHLYGTGVWCKTL